MGLDIYLYSVDQEEANRAHEQAWEDWYSEWDDKPDSDEKTAAKNAIPSFVSVDNVPSRKYPDHLFNRRYLRSSYNGGGFNNAVPDAVGADHGLYWIFEPVIGDNPEPVDNRLTDIMALEAVRARALRVAEELRDSDPLQTMAVDGMLGPAEHMWHELPSQDQVLAWYRDEVARFKNSDTISSGYSTAKGTVFGFDKGEEVLAVAVGANPLARFSVTRGAMPNAILVYRMSDEAKRSYVESAEIIAEFCDEAIDLIKHDGVCYMHWSG